jgi:hypothetical protein
MSNSIDLATLFRALAATDNVTYIVSPRRLLLRTTPAWERFARANGGHAVATFQPGTPLLDVIPEAMRAFYADGFDNACATATCWEHDYECSSPELYRRFRMIAYPFGDFLVVTHSLLVEHPHEQEPHPAGDDYVVGGVIWMCAHCRRVRWRGQLRWDWVPAYLAHPPANLSHGLCVACAAYHFGVEI